MTSKQLVRKIIIFGMGLLYFSAGINHFVNPGFYLPLIPPFFSDPSLINSLAGIAEIILGLGIFYFPARIFAAWGVGLMLLAFIPAHWHFIQINTCVGDGLCVPPWMGWVRLVIIQPLLIYWAIWVAKNPKIHG